MKRLIDDSNTFDMPRQHSFDERGLGEVFSQELSVSNGAMMSPRPNDHPDNNNEAKKPKLDRNENIRPSKVIHIRNIPIDVTETEIVHLGIPFGRITNVLVLKGKNQAFLEMEDDNSAKSMVGYFTTCMAQLRGRAVYVQFSNHKELKTDQSHSNASASAQAALQVASALSGTEIQGGPNTVLRVVVEHMVYPVTLDVLCQVFSKFGEVLKIITFTKNNTYQALIQYPNVVTAQAAKLSLDGQNIYNSCCTLRIEYSKLSNLNVKYNNDKSRDFTNPGLQKSDHGLDQGGSPGLLASPFAALNGMGSPLTLPNGNSRVGGIGGNFPNSTSPHQYWPWMKPEILGELGRLPLSSYQFPSATSSLGGATTLGTGTAGSFGFAGQFVASGCVLLVSNLEEELVTPDALFTLFGVYGDVQRVKVLYNKKDSALIQLSEPQQAHLAMAHLNKLLLFGKEIRVTQSKHQTVQLPLSGKLDGGLTKDYSNSLLHRFKKPSSKNFQNIYPPSATLHLSNMPTSVSEDEIQAAFIDSGFTVKSFKFFPKDKKMGLIQFPSKEEAVSALIKMHNFQLTESRHLRVSFSKMSI